MYTINLMCLVVNSFVLGMLWESKPDNRFVIPLNMLAVIINFIVISKALFNV